MAGRFALKIEASGRKIDVPSWGGCKKLILTALRMKQIVNHFNLARHLCKQPACPSSGDCFRQIPPV
jgi:hypothetical protein